MIDQSDFDQLKKALKDNRKSILIQNQLIPISIHPTVLTLGKWYSEEKERLVIHSMTRCKRCLNVRPISGRCGCKDKQLSSPFGVELPKEISKHVLSISSPKTL